MHSPRALVVATEESAQAGSVIGTILKEFWRKDGRIDGVSNLVVSGGAPRIKAETQAAIERFRPECVLLCVDDGSPPVAEVLVRTARERDVRTVIVVTAISRVQDFLELGVDDFVTTPVCPEELLLRFGRHCVPVADEEADLQKIKESLGLQLFVGQSVQLISEIRRIPAVARCDVSVLLSGETGTGKEICARAIHYLSKRADKPLIAVNCGAIPPDLAENELFGHEQGAFTGANHSSPGLISEAEGGTLFLDEVDSLSASVQVKLLRFLQTMEYRSLGCARTKKANVRIIAATNARIPHVITEGRLRPDLYYRLNVVTFKLPPLRERKDDIPLLARHFVARFCAEYKKPLKTLTPAGLRKLFLYEWPGNVRELENIMQRAVILSESSQIQPADLSLPVQGEPETGSFQAMKSKVVGEFERTYLRDLLLAHDGNISHAARAAKKNRRAFWELMRKHQISVPEVVVRPQQALR